MKYLCQTTVAVVLSFFSVTMPNALAGTVSQEPLLSKTVNVKPNIALLLDTSGSMDWECIYAKHVTDAFVKEGSTLYGLTTSCLDISDIRQSSPVNNLLYYNPKKTYMPGYTGGVQQGNASVGSTSIVTLYLPIPPKDPTTYTTSTAIKDPANYDKYEVTSTGFRKNNGSTTSTNIFGTHSGSRTDCVTSGVPNNPCTHAQERRNIANWRKFHLDRMAAAKTGLSAAFSAQADNFRLAYTDIYTGLGTMKDWAVVKSDFFTWLDARSPSGSTPLRSALVTAGEYYKDKTANTGPWGSKPWNPPAGETSADHYSCRRSYTMLITDGFYNDGDPSVNNPDSTAGTQYVHDNDSNKKYKYIPGSTSDVRSIGKSDLTSGTGGYSNTLADVAMKYWVTDLRGDLPNNAGRGDPSDPPFWQNMTTYMVSFGAPGSMSDADVAKAKAGTLNWVKPVGNKVTTIDDMRHGAHNGGGDFLRVNDAQQFAQDLGNVIGSIASQEFSQAGVAASAVTLTAGTKKFVPYYTSGTWWGNLQMVNLGATGDTGSISWQVISTDGNGQPTGTTTIPSPASRNIVVWVDQARQAIDFNFTNITASINNLRGTNVNMHLSNSVTSDIVDFLRGVRTKEGTLRRRMAILGDIVNSTPVFIKNNTNPEYEKLPAGTPGLSSYAAYMTAKAARTEGALLVGANDGMLHAFGEGYNTKVGGRELFAYVPRSVLGKMESLSTTGYTYNHTYTVDGPLSETDAYITTPNVTSAGSSTGWRNIVLGTTGAGAKSVFALNVTDPTSYNGKSVLWEINADPAFPIVSTNATTAFQDLGNVLSAVQSGITASGDWVSVFGNGYGSVAGKASLYVVETATGKLLKQITTDNATNNGLGGVRLVLNSQKQIIGAYAGDLRGRIWKFDLSGTSSSAWKLGNGGVALFTAMNGATPLPITAQPAVMERTDQAGYNPSYLVSFATGKLFEVGDAAVTSPTQYAYAIWDRRLFSSSTADTINDTTTDLEPLKASKVTSGITAGAGSGLNPGGIIDFYTVAFANTSTTSMNWSTKRGWKLPLDVFSGQRNVYPSNILGEVVKIDTVAPQASTSNCQASTSNALSFLINPLTASCRSGGTLDTNLDGEIDGTDANVCAYTTNADGMDVTLIIMNARGEDTGLRDVQNSTGHIQVRTGSKPPPQDCTNPIYAAAHTSECAPSCSDPVYAAAHVSECTTTDCSNAEYRAAHKDACPGSTLTRSWRQIFPRANN